MVNRWSQSNLLQFRATIAAHLGLKVGVQLVGFGLSARLGRGQHDEFGIAFGYPLAHGEAASVQALDVERVEVAHGCLQSVAVIGNRFVWLVPASAAAAADIALGVGRARD